MPHAYTYLLLSASGRALDFTVALTLGRKVAGVFYARRVAGFAIATIALTANVLLS